MMNKSIILAVGLICSTPLFLSERESVRYDMSDVDAVTETIAPVKEQTKTISQKPLMKDFIGINGHFHFKPELYSKVTRLVRNYHNLNWDVQKPGDSITIPVCVNKVNWERDMYSPWKEKGFETSICIQFSGFAPPAPDYISMWANQENWIYQYGKTVSTYFGPSGNRKLCTSMEIGNEPGGRFNPEVFKPIFMNMAKGIRDGDPEIKILTPTVHVRQGNDYSQDINSIYGDKDVLPLYDVINLHTYPEIKESAPGKSPWNRSYPEDTITNYMKVVDEAIEWRNKNAHGKEIWITEFGYDACTPEVMSKREGWALTLDWQGVTDLQQAQYIVRSFFLFAERDIQRAYIYYYDDDDEPSIHASAGLTRKFQPKPSFWAVKQMFDLLGEYRFTRVVQREVGKNDSTPFYVYEFENGSNPAQKIWAVWSPTGVESHKKDGYKGKAFSVNLEKMPGKVMDVIPMSLSESNIEEKPKWTTNNKSVELMVSESPLYIIFHKCPVISRTISVVYLFRAN